MLPLVFFLFWGLCVLSSDDPTKKKGLFPPTVRRIVYAQPITKRPETEQSKQSPTDAVQRKSNSKLHVQTAEGGCVNCIRLRQRVSEEMRKTESTHAELTHSQSQLRKFAEERNQLDFSLMNRKGVAPGWKQAHATQQLFTDAIHTLQHILDIDIHEEEDDDENESQLVETQLRQSNSNQRLVADGRSELFQRQLRDLSQPPTVGTTLSRRNSLPNIQQSLAGRRHSLSSLQNTEVTTDKQLGFSRTLSSASLNTKGFSRRMSLNDLSAVPNYPRADLQTMSQSVAAQRSTQSQRRLRQLAAAIRLRLRQSAQHLADSRLSLLKCIHKGETDQLQTGEAQMRRNVEDAANDALHDLTNECMRNVIRLNLALQKKDTEKDNREVATAWHLPEPLYLAAIAIMGLFLARKNLF